MTASLSRGLPRWSASASLVTALLLGACGGAVTPPAATASATSATAASAPPATATTAGSAAPKLPARVADASGKEVVVSSIERIVMLSGDNAEVVFAFGLGERIVGGLVNDTDFADAKRIPQPRLKFPFSAENVLSLNPTLVIGNNRSGPPPVLDQIRSAGVPVLITPQPLTIDGPSQKFRLLATALGVADRGEQLVKKYEADLAKAREFVASRPAGKKPRVLFLYVRGATGTQLAAGSNTEADVIITAAGAVNAGTDAGISGYQPMTPEAIVAAKPDAYLVLTLGLRSVGGIDGLLKIPGLDQTPAGKARTVIDFDDCYVLCMGPRQGEAVLALAKALRP